MKEGFQTHGMKFEDLIESFSCHNCEDWIIIMAIISSFFNDQGFILVKFVLPFIWGKWGLIAADLGSVGLPANLTPWLTKASLTRL